MPRDKSPSVLDENFPLTRRAPKFVRRWDEKEEEQLEYQIPPRPNKLPTPPQSVDKVLSDDGEKDEEIEVIGKTAKEDCKGPSKLLSSSAQQTKTTSSADNLVKTRPSHGDESGGANQVELTVVEDDDDEENKSKDDEVEVVTVTGVIATTEEGTQGGGSSDSLAKNTSSTIQTPENWEPNAQVEVRAPRPANVWGGRVPTTLTFLGLSGQPQAPVDNCILGRVACSTGNQVGGKENGGKTTMATAVKKKACHVGHIT